MYKKVERRIIIASCFLIALFLIWQWSIAKLSADYDKVSEVINIAGRQRMLSQKIAKDVAMLRENLDVSVRDHYAVELHRSIQSLEGEYLQLVEENQSATIADMLDKFEPTRSIFISSAQDVLKNIGRITPASQETLLEARMKVFIYEDDFLAHMDTIVNQYVWEAGETFLWIKRLQVIFLNLMIICSVILLVYVFVPAHKTIREWYIEAQENNTNMVKLFHIMRNAMFMLSKEGKVVTRNERGDILLERLGVSKSMEHIEELFKKSEVSWKQIYEQLLQEEDKGALEVTFGTIDPVIMEVSVSSGIYQRKEAILLNFYDVTEQKKIEETLTNLAVRDKLTGLYNRYHLETFIGTEIEQAERYDINMSMLIVDLDHFKNINDHWGHPIGDQVLKHTADLLVQSCRKSDVIFRLGGEEFMVVLSHTDIKGAIEVAEKIRSAIEKSIHPIVGKYTVSVGVAQRKMGETFRHIYQRTDEALYLAKSSGRNCVKESTH